MLKTATVAAWQYLYSGSRMQVEREIRIHSKLQHESIIGLYAAFEDADNVYMAQEFAEGASGPTHRFTARFS